MSKHFLAVVAVLMLLLSGCGTNAFAPPSGVIITVKAASIELKWNPVDSVSGYNVYRSSETGPLSTKTRIASGLSQPFYLDSYATPGVTYYYQITAFNSTGDSTASPELSATIKAAPASDVLMGGGVQGSPLHLSYSVSIFAGTTKPGSTDGQGKSAAFGYPAGITTDGRNLFIADTLNNAIRKVIISTGEVTTLAGGPASGTSDGVGSDARFYYPYGITTDGTSLFVSEFGNHMVRRIEITSGTVTTLAGAPTPGSSNGIGAAASFKNPRGITTDGTNLFVADYGNHTIRKIVISTGVVTTLAGSPATSGSTDDNGTAASFNSPDGITTDGTSLYVTDSSNHNIRKVTISTAAVTTVAGSITPGAADAVGTAASFNNPSGITTDGTSLYISDSKNNLIRKVDIITGTVLTVAGSGSAGFADGDGKAASFSQPMGITTDGANLFVTDYGYCLIREIL